MAARSTPTRGLAPAGTRPQRAFRAWGYLGRVRSTLDRKAGVGEPDCYDTLADLSEPENWDGIGAEDAGSLRLLRSYVEFTFEKLQAQGKVLVTADGRFAAFNTGLGTRHQQTIFGLFTQNRNAGMQPWHFRSWEVESAPILMSNFPAMPDFAHYTDNPADLIYDWRRELVVNSAHILAEDENLSRFPAGLQSNPFQAQLALDGAVRRAQNRVRRNYRAAVPFWYPTHDTVQLLLPLSLSDPSRVDLALVVSRQGEYYRGHTVLTMAMAYSNARLLARPDSDWLEPLATEDPEEGGDENA